MIAGLETYRHDISVLLRLIRKLGVLTEDKFDDLYQSPRRGKAYAVGGDTLILGICSQGMSDWSIHLDLLLRLVEYGAVNTSTNSDGLVVYSLGESANEQM